MGVKTKSQRRKRIHSGIRRKIKGTAERPRLAVYRSNRYISCQLIDDINGVTLAHIASKDEGIGEGKTPVERAKIVGELIAQKAADLKITEVKFDRSGYLYHGRVKALAEGAREKGLKF